MIGLSAWNFDLMVSTLFAIGGGEEKMEGMGMEMRR